MQSPSDIVLIITAASGLIAATAAAYKAYQAQNSSTAAAKDAAMVANFQKLYDEQSATILELKEDMKRVKNDQTDERKQWAIERTHFQERIDKLTEQNTSKDTKIGELSGMVKILQGQVGK